MQNIESVKVKGQTKVEKSSCDFEANISMP